MRLLLAILLLAMPATGSAQVESVNIPEVKIEGGRLGKAYAPLIARLRTERLVLLFRHDRTDVSGRWDYEPYVAGACDQQRVLSEAGRASATAVGTAIQLLRLPIRRVAASTYCRAVESARLMFGGVHHVTPALIGGDGKSRTLTKVRADVLKLIVETRPNQGLLAMVAHHGTIDAFTTRMLDEGDALVLSLKADGDVDVIAHIPAARWDEIHRDTDRVAYEPK